MIYLGVQILDTILHHRLHYFELFALYFWLLFFIKWYPSYRFYNNEKDKVYPYCNTPATVIIPVLNEKPALFETCLNSVYKQLREIDNLIIVFDRYDKSAECYEIAEKYTNEVWRCCNPGKREAVAMALRQANPIAIIMDSDSVASNESIPLLINVFSDPTIGGATSNQRILNPYRNQWSAVCNFLEIVRFTYGSQLFSAYWGQVGCLPGRMMAVRTQAVLPYIDKEYLNETFLGKKVLTSDDRRLTSILLKAGYKTTVAVNSCARTDSPDTFIGICKQNLRWNRGSIRCTIKDWRFLYKFKAAWFCFVTDIITVLIFLGLAVDILLRMLTHLDWVYIPVGIIYCLVIAAGGVLLTMGTKYYKLINRRTIKYFSTFCFFFCFCLPIITLWSLLTVTNSEWLTR